MNRVERIRSVVDTILAQQPDAVERRCGFVHLYGVAVACGLLALKRGLDPQLCTTAGMLHDIWAYKVGDPTNHAELGCAEARRLLQDTGEYTDAEISLICEAISNHSSKDHIHGEMSELLKDADVLQHYLYNTSLPRHESHTARLAGILSELGIREAASEHTEG